ncbi:two-component response regulator-like APRR1 isoform X1 [Malus domestica]|uniref:two-component response regulator-like APRR1 isoform X1 n=1 Tax=Malus domestica TaxID=3750 RepID=UPI0010AA32D9|nr:two-component response regulator-like APRR1 isoform X1 [Malus domestica]
MEKDKQIDIGNSSRQNGGSRAKSKNMSVDRSGVRILLCDRDAGSCEEVCTLLTTCSYQAPLTVISVASAVEVLDALNAEWSFIDIILAAIDLPIEASMSMLNYIMQDLHFKHIPVIMLATQDESRFLFNFLKFGATDYLVKPLCIDQILNLWMHTWRQRKQPKGLEAPQKNIGLVVSSEATMNNILVLDDTEEEFAEDPKPAMCIKK